MKDLQVQTFVVNLYKAKIWILKLFNISLLAILEFERLWTDVFRVLKKKKDKFERCGSVVEHQLMKPEVMV